MDKQRVAAVQKLEALGYSLQGGEWVPASAPPRPFVTAQGDVMHGVLVERADALEGCTEGSGEEVVNVIEAYEAVRWPEGKELRGKG